MPELSIVIPAYNEEARLLPVLESICSFISAKTLDFEIIVVNDGSADNTSAAAKKFADDSYKQVKLIELPVNRGKGNAIKIGVLAATGELILIDDADGSAPIEELDRLRSAIENGADLAIGSRAKPDSTRKVEALPYRTYLGNTFNSIVQFVLLPGIYDTQCGFKLFKKAVAQDLFSLATIDGYAFDVEILYLAKLRKYTLQEIAINWHNTAGSKVNVFTDSFKMLFEVLKIMVNRAQGKYLKNRTVKANECSSSTK